MTGLYRPIASALSATTRPCAHPYHDIGATGKAKTNGPLLPALLASLLLCWNTVQAQYIEKGDIAPFEVVYEVGNHLINAGTAKVSLTRDGDLWTYSLKTTPRGIIKLAGKGNINEMTTIRFEESDGKLLLRPESYLYRQDKERRRAVDATFDWSNKSITSNYRGKETVHNFEEPVIDRLSATLFMMNTLRRDFNYTELQVFDTDEIKAVSFTFVGRENLDTPLGELETLRVINQKVSGGSRQTTTWFAPSLDYVPVKIEQRKRGELVARFSLLELSNRVTDIQLEPSGD